MALLLHAQPYVAIVHLILLFTVGRENQTDPDTVWQSLGSAWDSLNSEFFRLFAKDMSIGISIGIAFGSAVGMPLGIAGVMVIGSGVGIFVGIAFGVACSIAVGSTFGIAGAIASGIALGIIFGITSGIAVGISLGIAFGIGFGIAVGIAFGIVGEIAVEVAFGFALMIAFWIACGSAVAIAFAFAFGMVVTRAYYLPPHLLYVWRIAKGQWYPTHPVAWDDLCRVPFPRLDRLLTAYAEIEPEAGQIEIERLIDSYPSQRMAALRARTALLARESGRQSLLSRLDQDTANLPEGSNDFLADIPRLRQMISQIAALQRQIDLITRPVFHEPLAHVLRLQIETFIAKVAGMRAPLAVEFRAAARNWLVIADSQWQEARAAMARSPTQQVFRAGDPVDRAQEAFVPRMEVTGDVERQIMLATGCPRLVLYGRRRTGKSTILRNLDQFLLRHVHVASLSMQDPEAFTSLDFFARRIATAVATAWPDEAAPLPEQPGLPGLFVLLGRANQRLLAENRRLLLAIDEYELIDQKIGEGVFPEDLLATMRESIQTHRRIVWIFAGSHDITELTHAPWTSYLVSARTIEVPLFTPAETRALLTEPLRYSPLWQKDDPKRPSFAPALWGENGIERIHAEAGGWPHLVQLIAETVVDLLNEGTAPNADAALLERALDKAIISGDTVLRELVQRESRLPGEWDYIRAFQRMDSQPPPEDEALHRSLRRRLMVTEDNGLWRMRVPLMQRRLRQRG